MVLTLWPKTHIQQKVRLYILLLKLRESGRCRERTNLLSSVLLCSLPELVGLLSQMGPT